MFWSRNTAGSESWYWSVCPGYRYSYPCWDLDILLHLCRCATKITSIYTIIFAGLRTVFCLSFHMRIVICLSLGYDYYLFVSFHMRTILLFDCVILHKLLPVSSIVLLTVSFTIVMYMNNMIMTHFRNHHISLAGVAHDYDNWHFWI